MNIQKNKIMESPVRNLIGKDTVIKGDGKIVIGQTGLVEGDLTCKQADISGVVKGVLKCEELTSFKSTARVEADMVTKQLFIEVGAVFTGKCQMSQPTVQQTKQ